MSSNLPGTQKEDWALNEKVMPVDTNNWGHSINILTKAMPIYACTGNFYTVSSFENNVINLTPLSYIDGTQNETPLSYIDGMSICFKSTFNNTESCFVNVNTLGNKQIRRMDNTVLNSNDIQQNHYIILKYDKLQDWFYLVYSTNKINDIMLNKAETSLSNLTPEGEKHFLGKPNITNCLTEVPQRIKADIVDGTLTVYAGSICIVPYGTEAPTYSVGDYLLGEANNNLYKIVDIQYTADVDYPVLDQPLLFYTVEVQRDISTDWVPPNATEAVVRSMYLQISGDSTTWVHGEITPHCTSGTTNSNTTGYSLFYNTSANTCQRLNRSQTPTQSVCSLPIMQVNYNLNNPKLDSILNIFDCVGFIGSTVYFYKNISMLMGIGKNSDGSQKNIEYTTDKLFVHTISPTVANYFYYVGFENGVSIDPNSKKLIFDNPNTTFVGSSSLGTFINGWKMWNFRTGKWEFYSSTMNDGVSFQVYNAIFGRLWFEDGKIIRIYLNPTGMIKTDEEKGVTTSEQDSLSAMGVPVSGANLNSFRKAGTYYFSSSHTPTNIPTGVNGVLQVITNEERTLVKQIWFRQGTIDSNDTQTWIRTYACTNTETNTFNWSKWQLIPTYTSKDATNGYAKIGNTIIQWGILQSGTSNNVAKTVTLPTPFSNSNYIVTPAKQDAHNSDYTSGEVSSKSTTSFKIYVFKERAYNWIAVGY